MRKPFKKYCNLFILCLFLFLSLTSKAQIDEVKYKSDSFFGGSDLGENVRRLVGNVFFSQRDVSVYCDSADVDTKLNNFKGYGNVHVKQGLDLNIYCAFISYNGNNQIGKCRDSVVVIDKNTTLLTDFLDFNAADSTGYFYNGGEIQDSSMNLTSRRGFFFPQRKFYIFKDTVIVKSKDYTIHSDTLKYDYLTEKAYLLGPTTIVSDSNYLYAENGLYDMKNNIGQFSQNAVYKSKEQQLKGDSLYYDRKRGIGKAYQNIELYDSTNNIYILGNYAFHNERSGNSFVTDRAVMQQISQNDTMFLHADTLKAQYDTTKTHREIVAYRKAQIFRKDLQARCDSIYYSLKDSIIQMHIEPILWSQGNQITAEEIHLFTKNNAPDKVDLKRNAFVVSQEDTANFNQIKGKDMVGFFRNNALYQIDVNKNGQTIYFTKDKEEMIGINKIECANMKVFLKEKTVEKILFLQKPTGTLFPPEDMPPAEKKLKNFRWLDYLKPKNKEEIFIWKKEKLQNNK